MLLSSRFKYQKDRLANSFPTFTLTHVNVACGSRHRQEPYLIFVCLCVDIDADREKVRGTCTTRVSHGYAKPHARKLPVVYLAVPLG